MWLAEPADRHPQVQHVLQGVRGGEGKRGDVGVIGVRGGSRRRGG